MEPFAFPKNHIRVTQIFKEDNHPGVDFGGVRIGDDVVWCIGDGEVTAIGYQPTGAGNYVKVYHPEVNMTSIYFHLETIYVREGDRTTKNTKLGREGSTGNSTGPHLHFGLYKGVYSNYKQNYVNPLDYLYAYPEQNLYQGTEGNDINEVLSYTKAETKDQVHWADNDVRYLKEQGVIITNQDLDRMVTFGEVVSLVARIVRTIKNGI